MTKTGIVNIQQVGQIHQLFLASEYKQYINIAVKQKVDLNNYKCL